ncbi:MAG TPA: pilus assembly protein PilP [Rhodocyclaceae bacterium]|nr:pilus assembly protein PilP [Rhodocyclaceae bacterium]
MRRPILIALTATLAACSGGDHEDLRQWMKENTKDLRGSIPPLPDVKPYEAVPYDADSMLDPFKSTKIEPESKGKQGSGKVGGLQPDFEARDIRNSPLEKYPLESLKMIGYLNVNGRPIAVVQVDQNIKQVKVGEYLGLDFGMVTQISEREVAVRELIQDSAGDWMERPNTLYLQGKEGGRK